MQELFRKFSQKISIITGTPWSFILSLFIIVLWGITGPYFEYSDTWQLVINTGTTIITFLMVFLIQNTQNREARATQLKLDELIRSVRGARNMLIELEDMSDEDLNKFADEFHELVKKEMIRRKNTTH
ncbi:low affinity iron permease family protein [Candidatus Woesebacteria bacterium]|nr:low affinity iron permease family protein [Candidatus Woesebacteria bacterium]